ncbi:MAG: class I SAM-dependent methyltransferase [Patulibacter minatonensis]
MPACPICGSSTAPVGTKHGDYSGRDFDVVRCTECRFAFVADPWTEYDKIYGDDYYAGKGVDPLVDYVHELAAPDRTIRQHEWRGIGRLVGELTTLTPQTTWLDHGCGTGGLVTYVNAQGLAQAEGFEEGWSEPRLRERGVPTVSRADLDARENAYDVITSIEVIEHVPDPVGLLKDLARLLKPGGVLFLTTGNAAPYADGLLDWRYVTPEIHISFFEPPTLARAMTEAGLVPEAGGFRPGWDDIIRFKLLKNLRRQDTSPLEAAMPWGIVTRALDRRMKISAHPIGRKP